ncbi:MAG: isocitrate lyase/phosphoenolpyruvate mutase family protein [Nocardioides sp.]
MSATEFLRLHRDPELLTVVNVWDVITARVVADTPGTLALATASHGIAATLGYADGENIPVDEMLDMCGRIAKAVDLPVSADLEGGYGDAPGTIRKAIGLGIVGANIEDQMKPLAEATRQVEQMMAVAAEEGVPDFVLNARTDAFVKAGDRDPAEVLADAVERSKAYVDAGAPIVFVPGKLDEQQVTTLVDAIGPQRLTVIGVPGSLPLAKLQELGVARVSYGPNSQRVALTALQELVEDVHAGGGLPETMRVLN